MDTELNKHLLTWKMQKGLPSTDVNDWPNDEITGCLADAEAKGCGPAVKYLTAALNRRPATLAPAPTLAQVIEAGEAVIDGSKGMERRGLKKDASPATETDGHSPVPESPDGGRRSILSIPLKDLQDDRENARKGYNPDKLSDLAASIRARGVLEPLIVKPCYGKPGSLGRVPGRYTIVAGHRRRRAAEMAGLKAVPCIVRADLNGDSALDALVENLQREDLSPMDEARGYVHVMKSHGLSAAGLAAAIGKGVRYVQQRAAIATGLIAPAQKALEAGAISASHADELARLAPDYQKKLWSEEWAHGREPSLKQLRWAIGRGLCKLNGAPWKFDAPLAGDGVESATCTGCKWNGGGPKPLCGNPVCYEAKRMMVVRHKAEEIKASGKPVLLLTHNYHSRSEAKSLPKGTMIKSYDYDTAKATEKGAVEVLDIDTGRTQWMKRTSSAVSNDSYSKRLREQERKRKEKEKAAKAAADAKRSALLPKIKAPLSRALRVEVVCFNFQRMWAAIKNPILRRHGWDKLGDDWRGRKVRAEIEKLSDDELARLEIEMVYEWGQDASELSMGKSKGKAKSLVQLMSEEVAIKQKLIDEFNASRTAKGAQA